MKNNKLLPCPFCGGKATTFRIPQNDEEEMKQHPKWKWRNPGMWVVGCKDDDMCMGNINHCAMIFIDEESAIKTWNTRKPVEKTIERLEKHKAEFKKDINSGDKKDIAKHCKDVRVKRGNCIGLDCFDCIFTLVIETVRNCGKEQIRECH